MTIEEYIRDEYSVCREERQYALFLNNILLKYRKPSERTDSEVKNIFAACGLSEAEVLNVFYEATFMRDIFERNRRTFLWKKEDILSKNKLTKTDYNNLDKVKDSFNEKLIEYAKKQGIISDFSYNKEHNLGGSKEASVLRSMMNSKPDIAVIYRKKGGEQKYLLFIECKFESSEGDDKCDNKQTDIQGMIADFLCENYFKHELAVSPAMVDTVKKDNKNKIYKSPLVQFKRDAATNPENKTINITDLIRLNNEIFGIKQSATV